MNPLVDINQLVYRFNEDEAVWQRFEEKRELRRRIRARSPVPDEVLDALDWQEAKVEIRKVRCVGLRFPSD